MKYVNRDEMRKILDKTQGKFFTVWFLKKPDKKTGKREVRRLHGHKVTKHLKGGKRTSDPNEIYVAWDEINKGYRSVTYDEILRLHAFGEQFVVDDERAKRLGV